MLYKFKCSFFSSLINDFFPEICLENFQKLLVVEFFMTSKLPNINVLIVFYMQQDGVENIDIVYDYNRYSEHRYDIIDNLI